jgi:hypothetical protein
LIDGWMDGWIEHVSTPSAKKSLAVGRVAPLSAQVVA